MSVVLGLSYNYHDAAAALLRDGTVVAASMEERHTRIKHDASFPLKAAQFCLDHAGISAGDLDAIAFYEDPYAKFGRIFRSSVRRWRSDGAGILRRAVDAWARDAKFEVVDQIEHLLGVSRDRVHLCEHHATHAASAFYSSPFADATVVTIDGVGESETCTVSIGQGAGLTKVAAVHYPHSLGLFYSAMTAYLGFEVNEGEYKVMGMAAYGHPRFREEIARWVDLRTDGGFRVSASAFNFEALTGQPFTDEVTRVLGPPRTPETPFLEVSAATEAALGQSRYADIASSVQYVTERAVRHIVHSAVKRTGIKRLCLAGGVALNSAANGLLVRELGIPMFVQPAAGDAGGALGAAQWVYHHRLGGVRRTAMTTAALGSSFNQTDIERALQASSYTAPQVKAFDTDDSLVEAVAELLAAGQVVGWLQGRSEWGPRALGQRSILASPLTADMQGHVNEKIKFREAFRPFAPAVPIEEAHRFFDLGDASVADDPAGPFNFMLAVVTVKPDAATQIPAVTHVDGSARVQTVRRDTNPLFHSLLRAFGRRTGVPVLLNTSFNLRGEPMVDSPRDAIQTFEWSGLDALVMERALLRRTP